MHSVDRYRRQHKLAVFALLPILITLIGFLSAGPASAHTQLVDTTPADGKRLTAAPSAISLTFNDGVLKLGATIKVDGPAGATALGAVKIKAKTVRWPITADLANGKYTVRWRVTAQDGHPIDGKFDFVLRAPVEPTGAPSPATIEPNADTVAASIPTVTPHTAEPEMTGAMPGMEGMSGPARSAQTNSGPTTGIAIAGLLLLTATVVGAIVIERRRRPPQGADPSGTATG
jgi:copper resistance protein C